ncbi:MAG: hypothetical protein GY852_10105 [bacterium]|nr:hypothetical protein [bacterium]
MNANGPQQEINYRIPGANEEYPLLYADQHAAAHLAAQKRGQQTHLSKASVLYFKAVLLLGTLIMAYMVFSPKI